MKLPKLNAFTLIELLVVVSIITIITGALIPSFSKYIKNQELVQSAEQVKSDLRTVQNNALAGASVDEKIEIDGNSLLPVYWGVKFTSGENFYTYFISTTDSNCDVEKTNKGKSNTFKAGITLTSDTSCIFFTFANGDASYSGSNTIKITGTTGSKCIKVEETGLINFINCE